MLSVKALPSVNLSFLFLSEAPVTLDPNTGDALLTIEEQMTRSTKRVKSQVIPKNLERPDSSNVLGSKGFSSGKHSWDVKVGGYWDVGVAERTKDLINQKMWGIYICACHVWMHEVTPEEGKSAGEVLSKDPFPQKVRVQRENDQGTLSIFDLDRKTLVHTIKNTFTETVFPYFRGNAKILSAR